MISRFAVLLCGCAAILWSCIPANYSGPVPNSGIGGTGQIAAGSSGIGGTGEIAENNSGIGGTGRIAKVGTGIGGTGMPAGNDGDRLGIIGAITGFGSIWVNGLEVEFSPSTPVNTEGNQVTADRLAKGQVVEVYAANHNGEVRAAAISIRYEVIGPVQATAAATTFQVLGQQVILTPETILPETWATETSTGHVVRVSGFRDGQGRVLASRVENGTADEPALLIGQARVTAEGVTVAGLPVNLPAGASSISSGDMVRVSGRLQKGILSASTLRRDDATTFFGNAIDRFLVQAIAVSRDSNNHYQLGGFPFKIGNPSAMPESSTGQPFLFMGTMDHADGMRLQHISPAPGMGQHPPANSPMGQPLMEQRTPPPRPPMSFSRPGSSGMGGRMGR